jgi:hypothetical protein
VFGIGDNVGDRAEVFINALIELGKQPCVYAGLLCGYGQDVLGESIQIIEEMDKGNGEKLSSLALNFRKLTRYLCEHKHKGIYQLCTASLVVC